MKKLLLIVLLMVCTIGVGSAMKPVKAQIWSGAVTKDTNITDNGEFVVKQRAELIYKDGQPIIGYGTFGRVNPVPVGDNDLALKISIDPIGSVEIDRKTGMPKASLLASWDEDMPFQEIHRTGNGGWEVIIPLGRRNPGTITLTAQIIAITGKKKTKYKILFITIPFFGKKTDIKKVVASSLDFEGFYYTSDRSNDPKSIALWVKDMIGLTTGEFAGTMPRYNRKLGSLPSDSVDAKQIPVNTLPAQPAPIVKFFELLPGTGNYQGKVILRAIQDVNNVSLELVSNGQVVESNVISCEAGKKFAINPDGLTDIRIGGQSWSLREQQ